MKNLIDTIIKRLISVIEYENNFNSIENNLKREGLTLIEDGNKKMIKLIDCDSKLTYNMWDLLEQWENELIEFNEIRLTERDYLFFIKNSKLPFKVEKEEDLNLLTLID